MKFIHAGDLHLGNPFGGLSVTPDWLTDKLQSATETAVHRLVDDAITAAVDFVVLAGDLFDSTTPDARAQLDLVKELERLATANIPVYIGFGNHDYVVDWQRLPTFPKNVTLFPEAVTTYDLQTQNHETVAISGFSYTQRHITTDQVAQFPMKANQADWHIGVYHGAVGEVGSGNYAPFNLQALQDKHYDYWALGHIHVREILQAKPFIGYSGSIQGLDKTETDAKGYYMVESDGDELVPTFTPVAPITWVTTSLRTNRDLSTVVQYVREQFAAKDEFELITLELITEEPNVLSAIMNQQLLAQFVAAAQPTDMFFIYDIQAQTQDQQMPLPAVDESYWSATVADVFTREQLQKLGLKQVTDVAVLDHFLNEQTLQELQTAVQTQLHLAQMGDEYHVD